MPDPQSSPADAGATPVHLDACEKLIPRDRGCHTVRFTQFLLPGCVLGAGEKYAIVPPRHVGLKADEKIDEAKVEREAERKAASFRERSSIAARIRSGAMPNPNARNPDVGVLRRILREKAPEMCRFDLSDREVVSNYAELVKREQGREIRRTARALRRTGLVHEPVRTQQELTAALKGVFAPGVFQPFRSPYPHIGFCAIFAQQWCHTGYTRGELITTIALAPGEELTLEMHTWTKENFRSERELAVESEASVSNRLTARDHLEVVSKLATETSIGVNAKVDVTIPVKGVPIGVGAGGDMSTTLSNALDTTVQRTVESTTEAATALRSQRKIRIEVARETGSEEKQLRRVANTNRCRTLNVHYFEIMSNYRVSMELVDLVPCVLVPMTEEVITVNWVLCHEHLLKGGLLSRTFLPGFAAAKTLATQAILDREAEAAEEAEAALPAPPSTSPTDPIAQEMHNHREAILRAYEKLLDVEAAQSGHIDELLEALFQLLPDIITAGAVLEDILDDMPKLFALGILRLNSTAVSALEQLQDRAEQSATESLRNFFAVVTPRDFKNVNPLGTIAGKALDKVGIPEEITDILVFTWPELLALVRDDCGLFAAVKAAHVRLDELRAPLTLADAEAQAGSVFEGAAGSPIFSAPEAPFSPLELAEAEVELERLRCHLRENRFHYFHLIWNTQATGETWRKVFAGLDCLLERTPIGFVDNKAAYPVQQPEVLRRWFPIDKDGKKPLKSFTDALVKRFSDLTPAPATVTLPTLGTVAEVALGQCEGCEEYIVSSRRIDLKQQQARVDLDAAKVRVENAEAERREMRLAATPPDLDDPVAHGGDGLTLRIEGLPSVPADDDG